MGRSLAKVSVLMTLIVCTACASAGSGPERGPSPSPGGLTSDQILAEYRQLAAENGEPAPSSIEYVRALESAADEAIFHEPLARGTADQQVYVVVGSGHFTGHAAKVPDGSALPTGSVLTQLLTGDGRVAEWSINDSLPALSSLGPPFEIK